MCRNQCCGAKQEQDWQRRVEVAGPTDCALRKFFVKPLIYSISGLILSFQAFAHTPHDVINAIAASPAYADDGIVIAANEARILLSKNGGDSWAQIFNGLDHKKPVTSMAIQGSESAGAEVLFLATSGDGVYRSLDQGTHWEKSNQGLDSTDIAFLKYALIGEQSWILAQVAGGGLFASQNAGEHWDKLDIPSGSFTAMDISGDRVYAADAAGKIFLSKAPFSEWAELSSVEGSGGIVSLKVPQSEPTYVLVGTGKRGLLKIELDSGQVTDANEGLGTTKYPLPLVTSFLVPRQLEAGSNLIYLTSWYGGAYRSSDGGASWERLRDGLTTNKQADTDKYKSPHFSAVVQAGATDKLFVTGFDGLFRKQIGSPRWIEMETRPIDIIKGFDVSGVRDSKVAMSLATYGGGGYISDDAGGNWIVANKGLRTTRFSDIAFSPNYWSDKTVFAGASGALLKSTDSGRTWNLFHTESDSWAMPIKRFLGRVGLGILARKIKTTDADLPPYPTEIAVSPDYANDNTVFFGTRWHGLYMSDDGGETQRYVWGKEHEKVVVGVYLSDDYRNDKTLFVSLREDGLFKSEDGGKTFQAVNDGLDFIADWSTQNVHNTHEHDLIVALSSNFSRDKIMFLATAEGLYMSRNGAGKWEQLRAEGLPAEAFIKTVAMSPDFASDKTLSVSAKGHGLYISRDGGHTFSPERSILEQFNESVNFLAFSGDYAADRKLIAASESNVYVSADAGVSWNRVPRVVRYENVREQPIDFTGEWELYWDAGYSASNESVSDQPGSEMVFRFNGKSVNVLGSRSPDGGQAEVYLDGEQVGTFSTSAPDQEALQSLYRLNGLGDGLHELKLVNAGGAGGGTRIGVDAFDVVLP